MEVGLKREEGKGELGARLVGWLIGWLGGLEFMESDNIQGPNCAIQSSSLSD